jgi:hypothetical protein
MELDLPNVVLGVHALIALVFLGLGIRLLLGGEFVGAALQVLLAVLLVGMGIAASRIVRRRQG